MFALHNFSQKDKVQQHSVHVDKSLYKIDLCATCTRSKHLSKGVYCIYTTILNSSKFVISSSLASSQYCITQYFFLFHHCIIIITRPPVS